MVMKILMNRSLFNLLVFAFLLGKSFYVYSGDTVTAKIIGNDVQWNNANINSDGITEQIWHGSDQLPLLPILKWAPAFNKAKIKKVTFKLLNKYSSSSSTKSVDTSFEHMGMEYQVGTSFHPTSESTLGISCSGINTGSFYRLSGSSSCVHDVWLKSNTKSKPYDFYRMMFKFDSLVEDFKKSKAPSGTYTATVKIPISFLVSYSDGLGGWTNSYQTNYKLVTFIVDYAPAFISSVDVVGNGKFDLVYNTDEHSVKGDTTFLVRVKGQIEPGLKMTFKSSGDQRYNLVNREGGEIAYSIKCDKCRDNQIVYRSRPNKFDKNGNAIGIIDFVGKYMDFYLKFYFDDMYLLSDRIAEGTYDDSVSILFEIDI